MGWSESRLLGMLDVAKEVVVWSLRDGGAGRDTRYVVVEPSVDADGCWVKVSMGTVYQIHQEHRES